MPESTETWLRGTPEPPFRWDVRKQEQLGTLGRGLMIGMPPGFVPELVMCSARVVASCADGDLFFVGRSPDNIFDLLSGLLAGTSWEDRIHLFPISLKWSEDVEAREEIRNALRRYLANQGLAPGQMNGRHRPTVLVDIVAEGRTFGELVGAWQAWAREEHVPWVQLRRKIRLIGITGRTRTSPKTWRWQQHAPWAPLLPPRSIKNVSVPWELWNGFASRPKASRTFPPSEWGDPRLSHPGRREELGGLKEAAFMYRCGLEDPFRDQFAEELLRTPSVRHSWARSLSHEVRAQPNKLSRAARARRDAAREAERIAWARQDEARRAIMLRAIAEQTSAAKAPERPARPAVEIERGTDS